MSKRLSLTAIAVSAAMLLAACQSTTMQPVPSKQAIPTINGVQILKNPPAVGSAEMKADQIYNDLGRELRKTEYLQRAKADADTAKFSVILERYSRVSGLTLTEQAMPETYRLLEIAWKTILKNRKPPKKHFARARPPVDYAPDDQTCRPDLWTSHLKNDPSDKYQSYPSGHTLRAWGMGLVLAAVYVPKAEDILRESYEMGESRWVCGPHWKSDVEAARVLAAAVFSRLVGDESFMIQLARAKAEVAAIGK